MNWPQEGVPEDKWSGGLENLPSRVGLQGEGGLWVNHVVSSFVATTTVTLKQLFWALDEPGHLVQSLPVTTPIHVPCMMKRLGLMSLGP